MSNNQEDLDIVLDFSIHVNAVLIDDDLDIEVDIEGEESPLTDGLHILVTNYVNGYIDALAAVVAEEDGFDEDDLDEFEQDDEFDEDDDFDGEYSEDGSGFEEEEEVKDEVGAFFLTK